MSNEKNQVKDNLKDQNTQDREKAQAKDNRAKAVRDEQTESRRRGSEEF